MYLCDNEKQSLAFDSIFKIKVYVNMVQKIREIKWKNRINVCTIAVLEETLPHHHSCLLTFIDERLIKSAMTDPDLRNLSLNSSLSSAFQYW